MWNKDFYPTPKELAFKLFNNCKTNIFHDTEMILEPSAGKGDLIDAYCQYYKLKNTIERIHPKTKESYSISPSEEEIKLYCNKHIHCIEIEVELSGILKNKGYNIVGNDFLSFEPDTKYNFIMMNPPFTNGYKHIQKAWEILDDGGEIACILPSNFLSTHQKYQNIFSTYGEVVPLGNFNDNIDVFRKANVHVSGFYLRKPIKKSKFYFNDVVFDTDENIKFSENENLQSEIAIRDIIGNYVIMYNKVIESFIKVSEVMSEYAHYIKPFVGNLNSENYEVKDLINLVNSIDDSNQQRYIYNNFINNLKESAWKKIFSLANVDELLTKKIKEDFINYQKEQSKLSFSQKNIENFIQTLYMSQKNIKEECIVDAFDTMTSFDKRNKIHIEGWKTNSFYKVNKKVIVPYGLNESNWFSKPSVNYYNYDKLMDIDKALCFLDGKKYSNIKTIVQTINEEAKEWNTVYESEFFYIRCYKKGTIHLTFKDLNLLSLFNRNAVKDKWNYVGYEE